VYPTTPSPAPGAVAANNASDTGAIYLLNIPVVSTGDHIIIVECLDRAGNIDSVNNLGATIFRNNGITGSNTYPMSVPNIFSITGNSAGTTQSQFYYFFYDTKISTGACVSDRISVVATTAVQPVVTPSADSLVVNNVSTGLQWYRNDTAINGATSNHYKPTSSGSYKVIASDGLGCFQSSDAVPYTVTATVDVIAREIKLKVSPNPNNGVFNLSFEVNSKADLSIDLFSASGQRVYNSSYPNFTGQFSQEIRIPNLSSEFYLLKIQHNKKTYVQKVLIQR
jgi:hypothetical protein